VYRRTRVCFRHIIVNSLHEGDNKDDDDDDNNNNNNNNNNNATNTIRNKCYVECERIVTNKEENGIRVETGRV
jgi:hypothetical protein